jgi:hypothetical protein
MLKYENIEKYRLKKTIEINSAFVKLCTIKAPLFLDYTLVIKPRPTRQVDSVDGLVRVRKKLASAKIRSNLGNPTGRSITQANPDETFFFKCGFSPRHLFFLFSFLVGYYPFSKFTI